MTSKLPQISTGPSPYSSHKSVGPFLRCPQLYAWIKMGVLGGGNREPLIVGSMLHAAYAHYYLGRGDEALMAIAKCAHDLIKAGESESAVKKCLIDAPIIYQKWLANPPPHFDKILEVETVHVGYLGGRDSNGTPRFPVSCRMDLVIQDSGGRIFSVDHKNVSEISDRVMSRYTLDTQFLVQNLLGKHKWGERWGGIVLHLVAKKTGKYKLRPLPPAPSHHAMGKQILLDGFLGIERLEREGRPLFAYPRTASELVCRNPYGICEGFELCAGGFEAFEKQVAEEKIDGAALDSAIDFTDFA